MPPIAIIQARMGSTRLPGKVLKPILGYPMLWHIVQRANRIKGLSNVVVATTDLASDEPVRLFCQENDISLYSGSENDVLDRFYLASAEYSGDPIIRITGDCPLVDSELITRLLEYYLQGGYDHAGIATGAGAIFLEGYRYPDGLDAECFSFAALERAWLDAKKPSDREHVTPYIWLRPEVFKLGVLKSEKDFSHLRLTVDNEEDFKLISKIYEALYSQNNRFSLSDVLECLRKCPDLSSINQSYIGKERYAEIWTQK